MPLLNYTTTIAASKTSERYSKPFSEFASQFPWVG
jgi:hypothetical protein